MYTTSARGLHSIPLRVLVRQDALWPPLVNFSAPAVYSCIPIPVHSQTETKLQQQRALFFKFRSSILLYRAFMPVYRRDADASPTREKKISAVISNSNRKTRHARVYETNKETKAKPRSMRYSGSRMRIHGPVFIFGFLRPIIGPKVCIRRSNKKKWGGGGRAGGPGPIRFRTR